MSISAIACMTNYKGMNVISIDGQLFSPIKDLEMFKRITSTVGFGKNFLSNVTGSKENGLFTNHNINGDTIQVVCMGSKTWKSLPKLVLKDRLNIVITTDYIKLNTKYNGYSKLGENTSELRMVDIMRNVSKNSGIVFMNFSILTRLLLGRFSEIANFYVIGGGEVYSFFMNNKNTRIKPTRLFITECYNVKINNTQKLTIFPLISNEYRIYSVSEKLFDPASKIHYRFLSYSRTDDSCDQRMCSQQGEYMYLNLVRNVLSKGHTREDRTGTGTIGIFGTQLKFDISKTIPLLTTKKMAWKSVVEELLWILRGDTDANVLKKKNVHIWDGNSTREFLDKRGLTHYPEGVLGPVYGFQLRHFGAKYSTTFADTENVDTSLIGGVDQILNVIHLLRNDPFSRRIYISYWNPNDLGRMALPPCHTSIQFYVAEKHGQKYLSCHFTMRSNDLGCGFGFNVLFYTILTYIIALKVDMLPDKLVYTAGDCHIYKDHFYNLTQQINRIPCAEPILLLNKDIKYKDFSEITVDDFDIVGYNPHPFMKFNMSA